MRKRIMAIVLATVMLVGSTMCVNAAPQKMPDGNYFDAEYYAQNNPDVVAVLGNDVNTLYNHYVGAGKAEGRLPYDPNALPTKEIEPNHSRERATNIMVGIACTGELGSFSKYRADGCTDVDWFSISLEGGKKYRIDMPGFSDNFASTTMMANIITPEERQDNGKIWIITNRVTEEAGVNATTVCFPSER